MADQGSEGLLSPYLRQKRLKAAVPHLRGRVLDFGCGGGHLARHCEEKNYLGVDRDASALSAAQAAFPKHRFQPDLVDAGIFDTIVALAVIEHLKQPSRWLSEMNSLLCPGGSLIVTTPHPLFRAMHDFGARLGIFSQEASDEHETFFNEHDLRVVSESEGFLFAHYSRFLYGANQLAVLRKPQ